ncbi:MAG: serine/threonine protein kinase [Verrucomicrobia bacterium]|nr:serine/threonine protein kinase [Verrucomicrobiota bacterium]MCH8510472.1 serine/threonine protein kinase [Kiritimatiellia bacterium]
MNPFAHLHPHRVIALVEEVLDVRAESICRPLTSYINRVFEVQLENGEAVVVKFHRPGRWTVDALSEEHDFVLDLAAADIPVVAPMEDEDGNTLFEDEGIWFAITPRKRGRPFEDPTPATWQDLGRTLARVHVVGDEAECQHRLHWHPEEATLRHLDYILEHAKGGEEFLDRYADLVEEMVEAISPLFDEADFTRLHGDMHVANLFKRPDESGIYLIDFDDMCFGPPVQDIWMLLPGTVADSGPELEHLLYGYRQIREFSPRELDLVEPLRAMRFVHFTAWCALQQEDGGTNRLAENFDAPAWWRNEFSSLQDQRERIREINRV